MGEDSSVASVTTNELEGDKVVTGGEEDVDSQQYYIHLLLSYVAPSLLCLISVVGVIGNSFVIYVIASEKHMRSSATNILLCK